MMKLDDRIIRLIAVGASVTANCQPCLEINIAKALENGADEGEISEAIEVGKRVRAGAASKMDQFASDLDIAFPASVIGWNGECGCGSSVKTIAGGQNE